MTYITLPALHYITYITLPSLHYPHYITHITWPTLHYPHYITWPTLHYPHYITHITLLTLHDLHCITIITLHDLHYITWPTLHYPHYITLPTLHYSRNITLSETWWGSGLLLMDRCIYCWGQSIGTGYIPSFIFQVFVIVYSTRRCLLCGYELDIHNVRQGLWWGCHNWTTLYSNNGPQEYIILLISTMIQYYFHL